MMGRGRWIGFEMDKKKRTIEGWLRHLQNSLLLATMSVDYADLRQRYVVGKWRLPDGCSSEEEFGEIEARWWKEYWHTKSGHLVQRSYLSDLPPSQGGNAPAPTGGSVDDEASVVNCLQDCQRLASVFGLTKNLVFRSLFLPAHTVASIKGKDVSELIDYAIVPHIPIYEDSPIGQRLLRAAEESDDVCEALRRFRFTSRGKQLITTTEDIPLHPSQTSNEDGAVHEGADTSDEPPVPKRLRSSLSAYELFTWTLDRMSPDVPLAAIGVVRGRVRKQIRFLCRAIQLRMPESRGRPRDVFLALECARLKDEEHWSLAQIGRKYGWEVTYDELGENVNQCRKARYYVSVGRRLKEELGYTERYPRKVCK